MALGAEEAYSLYRRPSGQAQADTLALMGRATDRAIGTRQWLAEEQVQSARQLGADLKDAGRAAFDEYDRSNQRGYRQKADQRAEEQQGFQREGAKRDQEMHPINLEGARNQSAAQRAAMEASQLQAQGLKADLDEQGRVLSTGMTVRQANTDYDMRGKQSGLKLTDAQIRSSDASASNAAAMARLNIEQAEELRRQGSVGELTTQLKGPLAAKAQAQATGDVAGVQAAETAIARVKANYPKLPPTSVGHAEALASESVNSAIAGRNEVWHMKGEGVGYQGQKAALDDKISALRRLQEATAAYKKAPPLSPKAEIAAGKIKTIMAESFKDAASGEDATGGLSVVPEWAGGAGFGQSGNDRATRVTQDVVREIEADIDGLKSRYIGRNTPPDVAQEIQRMEAAVAQAKSGDAFTNKNTFRFAPLPQPPPRPNGMMQVDLNGRGAAGGPRTSPFRNGGSQ